MTKKKGKSVSFDAMVKFFMQAYDIPSKKDVDKVMSRIKNLEDIIKKTVAYERSGHGKHQKKIADKTLVSGSASDKVFEIVKKHKNGVSFAKIKEKTDFNDKKLRNIIYRLDKTNKISRLRRGVYIISSKEISIKE